MAFLPAAAHPSVLCKQRGGNLSRARREESDPERAKKGRRDDDREEGRDENEGICQSGIGGWTGLAHPITGSFNSAGSALSANIHNAIRYNCWPGLRFNSINHGTSRPVGPLVHDQVMQLGMGYATLPEKGERLSNGAYDAE